MFSTSVLQVSRVQTPVTSSNTVAQTGISLSGGTVTVNNLAQSTLLNVGATPQQQTQSTTVVAKQNSIVQQTASPASGPVPQMMSVQIPVTNASGQTVYQTIQVTHNLQLHTVTGTAKFFNVGVLFKGL